MKKMVLSFLMIAGFTGCVAGTVQASEEHPITAVPIEEPIGIPSEDPNEPPGKDPNTPVEVPAGNPVYRMYNPNSGEHLYTPSLFESRTLFTLGWKDEGTAWVSPSEYEDFAIHRVYNPNAGDHHYTVDVNEKNHLIKAGWEDDMLSFPSANDDGIPIYRLYNPNAKAGAHHFTVNGAERDMLVSVGWKYEGIGFYALR